jgi:hypothetical protein
MRAPEVLVIGDANPDLVLAGDVEPSFGQVEAVDAGPGAGWVGRDRGRRLARRRPHYLAAMVGDDVFGQFVATGWPRPSTRGFAPAGRLSGHRRAVRR